ncbi:putative uncharacterized protein [Parachlamydia acanthamoebae UV-7]|uniref:Uncharacterized protein n=1 Tax=Parachlamydia acanthamoebae (strain UV7) TaxID=765952 RepID=F8L0U8_PARAV|nr:hypothetical protein pah_c004o223 [Parachlamydia acanthamoebae str. Hall's coccus]CCB86852.1 putative uncharacterized protein [Parachlamydia acanthamoebae UV-7]
MNSFILKSNYQQIVVNQTFSVKWGHCATCLIFFTFFIL